MRGRGATDEHGSTQMEKKILMRWALLCEQRGQKLGFGFVKHAAHSFDELCL